MKLLKKLIIGSMVIGLSATSLGAIKIPFPKSIPSQPKSSSQSFTLNMATARRLLEVGQVIGANKFEKCLVNSIVNLNQARLQKAMKEGAEKTSKAKHESIKLKPLPEGTSNPAFKHYCNKAKEVLQAREDRKGRIFWRKLLRLNKVFDNETLQENSLADLIDVERLYPSREIFVRTKKYCPYNYCYVPKIYNLPLEDSTTVGSTSNLKKLIISLAEDYGVLTIGVKNGIIHLVNVNPKLELCKIETDTNEEIWSLNTLEGMCRDLGSLRVYYLEKLEK